MMWYWGGGVHWWGWLLGVLGMVVFWGVVVWVMWYLVTAVLQRPDAGGPRDDPRRILDERLARGEIDAEEYRRVRDLIAGRAGDTAAATSPAGERAGDDLSR
ncbi:MAG: SHOCT domain-containing protein [Acidimicrobiales bacterium]